MQPTKVQVVVFRRTAPDFEPSILLMEKSVNGHSTWSLVTGFIEAGEKPEETALREVGEETGLEELGAPLNLQNEVTFVSHYTNKHESEVAFAVESTNATEGVDISNNPDTEHTGFRWVEPEEAFMELQWDSFKESVRCLLQQIQD